MKHLVTAAAGLLGAGLLAAVPARADGPPHRIAIEYENLAAGQGLSTSAFVAHRPGEHLWVAGKPAELPLQMLAEQGNPEWILGFAVADQGQKFGDAAVAIPALPGQRRRVEITVTPEHPQISGAVMLGQTNDGFAGIDAVPAYGLDKPLVIEALPLDAGTAKNQEDRDHLLALGGFGREAEHGVVAPHPGLQPGGVVPDSWRFDPAKPVVRFTLTPLATPNG